MLNKKAIEDFFEYYDLEYNEILNLFDTFANISLKFLYELDEELPDEDIKYEHEYEKIYFDDTIKLIQEFLAGINKKYLDIFNKSLVDGTFEFYLPEDDLKERPDEAVIYPNPNAIIYIPIQNNIQDGIIIVHEFFHYLNDFNLLSRTRALFTEMFSIYFELRFAQFIVLKNMDINSFNRCICERVENSALSSDNLFFISAILDVYSNYGTLNKKSIKFIDKYRQNYGDYVKEIVAFYRDREFIEELPNYVCDVSYTIGTLLSFYMLKEPMISDIKMCYINDNINSMNIEQVLKILETNFDCYDDWIEACIDNFKKAKGELDGKSYSYSRTNGCRKN